MIEEPSNRHQPYIPCGWSLEALAQDDADGMDPFPDEMMLEYRTRSRMSNSRYTESDATAP